MFRSLRKSWSQYTWARTPRETRNISPIPTHLHQKHTQGRHKRHHSKIQIQHGVLYTCLLDFVLTIDFLNLGGLIALLSKPDRVHLEPWTLSLHHQAQQKEVISRPIPLIISKPVVNGFLTHILFLYPILPYPMRIQDIRWPTPSSVPTSMNHRSLHRRSRNRRSSRLTSCIPWPLECISIRYSLVRRRFFCLYQSQFVLSLSLSFSDIEGL